MRPRAVVIGADTIVVSRGRRMGKPNDGDEARTMLHVLHGRQHEVWSGIAVVHGRERRTAAERTVVRFVRLSPEEIDRYVASGEPLDKAGAYAIQGLGAAFVQGIEGDYFNVVGLPLSRLRKLLAEFT
jgi:septum formation protein